jgi:hypothetical protein
MNQGNGAQTEEKSLNCTGKEDKSIETILVVPRMFGEKYFRRNMGYKDQI